MSKVNIIEVASYIPARCGIATFAQEQLTELQTNEKVNSFAVAVIDSSKGRLHYNSPADKNLQIDAFDESSWNKSARAILHLADTKQEFPTCVILQHEYGLDKTLQNGQGNAYQQMAKILREAGEDRIITLASLHTVRSSPDEHQRQVLRELSDFVDGVIVPSKIAVEILASQTYGIPLGKLKHIDHGIRVEDISSIDPIEVKRRYNLDGKCVITTAGLKSPGKGLEFGIEAYGQLIKNHFSSSSQERKKLVYLIAGEFHPTWISDDPEGFRKYNELLTRTLKKFGLRSITLKSMDKLTKEEADEHDVIILDTYLQETLLREIYSASDIVLLPYRNIEQISSGNLAEAVGFGKPVIATEFYHAQELLIPVPLYRVRKTPVDKIDARGFTVKLRGKYRSNPDVKQMTECLEFLVFHPEAISQIGKNSRERGFNMSWPITVDKLLRFIGPMAETKFFRRDSPVIVKSDHINGTTSA